MYILEPATAIYKTGQFLKTFMNLRGNFLITSEKSFAIVWLILTDMRFTLFKDCVQRPLFCSHKQTICSIITTNCFISKIRKTHPLWFCYIKFVKTKNAGFVYAITASKTHQNQKTPT